ncbi:MAG: hypothetical protein WCZ89_08785 [Phycisphaerae bacterium]
MNLEKSIAAAMIFIFLSLSLVYASPQWCPDLHTDDFVNLKDFAVLANNWDKSGSGLKGDIDGNGTVGPPDLEYLIHYWLKGYECRSADFNLDYKINFKDIASLANLWLTDANSINWDEKYDLDYSQKIDLGDLSIICRRWLKTYPKPSDTFVSFKNALAAGNTQVALTFVADRSRDRYSRIFQAIGTNLPNFAAGMGTLTLQEQSDSQAVYEMTHQAGAITYSFPVFFIKDDDGNWKIYNF